MVGARRCRARGGDTTTVGEDTLGSDSTSTNAGGLRAAPAFAWKDHGRFVELYPVRTGWLLLWGRYEDLGRRKVLAGNRTYPDPASARRRVADAALELTGKRALAAEALLAFDRARLPPHQPKDLPPLL